MNRKRIAITGASGFVGKNLIRGLEDNFELFAFSRNESSGAYTYEELFNRKVECDVLIHLAGKAHDIKNSTEENEYLEVNYELTKKVFTAFLNSTASTFIFMSSVKAAADTVDGLLYENHIPDPQTPYGKSKLLAEQYILENLPNDRAVFILRPCIIHGPGNKGNLNLLYKLVSKNIPWPLAAFQNKRSFCSIGNLVFVVNELILRSDIPSGVYHLADDEHISTNELITIIANSWSKKPRMIYIPKKIIRSLARFGDFTMLPFNSEKLKKLTENYCVSNEKIGTYLRKELPISAREGLINTFNSFRKL